MRPDTRPWRRRYGWRWFLLPLGYMPTRWVDEIPWWGFVVMAGLFGLAVATNTQWLFLVDILLFVAFAVKATIRR